MNTTGTNLHPFFDGVGAGINPRSTLPNQVLPDNKKKEAFKKATMDALETIAIAQRSENAHFEDYYKMVDGKLVYSDYGIEEGSIIDQIRDLNDGVIIPSFVKHYDIIGIIANQLVGEYINQEENYKIATDDPASKSDFLRERDLRLKEYTSQAFQLELKKLLVLKGINPDKQEFQSEEERQAYLQYIEQQKNELISPAEIQADMSKNFKTKAAEWAEKVIESDQTRFNLQEIDAEQAKDMILTGRYFRHFYVGYDYYKPERWHPIEVFFSKDTDTKYPQDGEYIGRLFYLSPYKIIERWGHKLTPRQIKDLTSYYGNGAGQTTNDSGKSMKDILENGFGERETVPFFNYYDYDLGLQYQDAFDVPMGHTFTKDEEGNEVEVPAWLSNMSNNHNYHGYRYSQQVRNDISIRTDILQVTEAYWKSWKRMWFINYTTEDGIPETTIVTDDILPGFIEENGLKKVSTKSVHEMKQDLEPDTMYEFWIPEVWRGIKINNGNSKLREPIYLDIEPLDYQIKGDSNIYDIKLPVGGIITNSVAEKIRPFQVGYNICLNQIFNLLEKEIGTFFLFDINFLPSEYKDQGDTEAALLKLRDMAKEVGLVPLDTTKQNAAGANQSMNTFMTQSITYDAQINSRVQLASYYQQKALEVLGITPQRIGTPGKYETAQGIQQGAQASYTQTEQLFTTLSTARLKTMELHLAVAQYCQKEYLDADIVFTMDKGTQGYLNLTDPDFPLRRIGVWPTSNSKQRRELEQLKQVLLQTNTLGNDMLDYAQLFAADTIASLVAIGRKGRMEKMQQEQAQRDHEAQLQQQAQEFQSQQLQMQQQYMEASKERDRQTDVLVAKINAESRLADSNANAVGLDMLERISKMSLQEDTANAQIETQQQKIQNDKERIALDREAMTKKLEQQMREFQQRERKMQSDQFIALSNKN